MRSLVRCWRATVVLLRSVAWLAGCTTVAMAQRAPVRSAREGEVRSANAGAASRNDTLRLDLAGSVSLALERASPILLGREDVRLGGVALLESYGRFLPDVRAGASSFDERGTLLLSSTALKASDASLYGAAYGLSTSVNLFNGLSDREHLRATILERDGLNASLERAR